jgi:hypothetical protein
MATSSRPQRKRKQPDLFTPISWQEEMTLRQALQTSLRPIPLNGSVSEDEVTSDDEVLDEEDIVSDFIDEKNTGDEYEMKWSKQRAQINVAKFTQSSGPTKILSSQHTVKSFFDLMFSKKILELICTQTNIYAQQRILLKPDPAWKPFLPGELKAWIGCLLAMGLNKKPNLKMYWDTTWKLPMVADRFTRDRFYAIKKYLHLADNSTMVDSKSPNADRLAKVRPLMNLLKENFQAQYSPSRFLTADEDMCKFKGRNVMKQYLRAKIVRWGYRIWKLCDANNAYVLSFDVYTGAESEKKDKSLPHSVVMGLMEGYLDKNHVVVMDNFFTSIPLFVNLLTRSTYACGTVRANRKYLPEEYKIEQDMEPGESDFWQSENFVATLWQDKRAVRFLSTCCEAEGDDTVKRRRTSQEMLSLNCPPVVKLYAQYMGGVDRSDRMVRTYSVSRPSKKWWFRLFYYFLDMAVANSFILYNNSPNHDELSELDYIKQLSLSLIATFSKDEKVQSGPERKRTMVPAIPRLVTGNHWPLKTKERKECQQCKRKGRKGRRTFYTCESCGTHLCIGVCFKRYHTRR